VPRDELADAIWGEELPATWEKALRVLMTKLRRLLEECGIDGSTGLTSSSGYYTLSLPPDTWIDVRAAVRALEKAETALTAGDPDGARAQAETAATLCRPTFLPGEEGPWVEEQRRDLRDVLLRSLECLRDASLAAGEDGDAVRSATEITELEPFRESSYRALMRAHVAAGNPAEALRVYERCRRFLADELGAYPSAESEAVYLEILRDTPGASAGGIHQGEQAGRDAESLPPPDESPRRTRRWIVALAIAALLVAGIGTAAGLALDSHGSPQVRILPNSLVRIDPHTLKPTKVVSIPPLADLVVASGGYIWTTHGILRYTPDDRRRNAGDRQLTRIDPSTGKWESVSGGVAPCGLTPDPSGDVWVANCYSSGRDFDVMRVHAKTKKFDPPLKVPAGDGYFRGMEYGGGSLWVAGVCCRKGHLDPRLTRLDPETGFPSHIVLKHAAISLAWSDGYDELWMTNDGSIASRLNTHTNKVRATAVTNTPSPLAVSDGVVWVGDWEVPTITRFPADGTGRPLRIPLRVPPHTGGVTSIAAGDGYIWATVPDIHALIRIDPKTNRQRKIPLRYAPWGVTVEENGAVWVTLRWRNTYGCALPDCKAGT
jgi:DNA-binding SARP family transcriptional activator/streptogramin lyase